MKLIAERKIDELGRIVLPAEIRLKLGLNAGNTVKIYDENGCIILKASEPYCKLCGSNDHVDCELYLCEDCIDKVKSY